MTHYHKLILDNSRIQLQFDLKNLEDDLQQISVLIGNLLAEKDWHVSQAYIAQVIAEGHRDSGLPLAGTLFLVEADTAAKVLTCRTQPVSGGLVLDVIPN